MADLSAIEEQVAAAEGRLTAIQDAGEATTALLDEVAQLVRDAADDPEQVRAIADRLTAVGAGESDVIASLAAATLRNTDVDPTPPATPEP